MQLTIILAGILLGIGITTTQITSSAFTSDLIGQNTVKDPQKSMLIPNLFSLGK